MEYNKNPYEPYAELWSKHIAGTEALIEGDFIVDTLLSYVGDVNELVVLDAGCGEGYVSRKVTTQAFKTLM